MLKKTKIKLVFDKILWYKIVLPIQMIQSLIPKVGEPFIESVAV